MNICGYGSERNLGMTSSWPDGSTIDSKIPDRTAVT
jgi:hypothetical protein